MKQIGEEVAVLVVCLWDIFNCCVSSGYICLGYICWEYIVVCLWDMIHPNQLKPLSQRVFGVAALRAPKKLKWKTVQRILIGHFLGCVFK